MCTEFAEIHYYVLFKINNVNVPLAIASFHRHADVELYRAPSKTYASMQHSQDSDVCEFEIKCVNSVVMMAPDTRHPSGKSNCWFMMEKLGLKIVSFLGINEDTE